MKNYAPMLVLGMFVLSACIKHPEELPLPKPFLIKKVEMIRESFRRVPKSGDTPYSRGKWIWEIEYNADCQIRLIRFYSSRIDTMKIQLVQTTTFLYDSQDRIKEARSQSPGGSFGRKFFSYHGNNKLPFLVEDIPAGEFIQGYEYRGDTLFRLYIFEGIPHTVPYIYRNGNLTFGYDKYDNNPPIQKYMNLSRGDIFSFPGDPEVPRLSRNNWTRFAQAYSRHIRYNELGLPVFLYILHLVPWDVTRYSTRFEY
jgi:hypothetical protein